MPRKSSHGGYNIPHDNPAYEMETGLYATGHNVTNTGISAAVRVQNAYKTFGSGPKILNNLNMTVEKGTMWVDTIY